MEISSKNITLSPTPFPSLSNKSLNTPAHRHDTWHFRQGFGWINFKLNLLFHQETLKKCVCVLVLVLCWINTAMHLSQWGRRTGFPLLWDTGAIKHYIATLNPSAWFKGPVLPKSRALGRTCSSKGTQMETRKSSRGVHVVLRCAVLCQVISALQNATASSLLFPFFLRLM